MIVSVYKPFGSFARIYQSRNSCSHTFDWIGVFKNFAKFTGKRVGWSLFLIKLKASGLQLCSKEAPAQVLSCELCEIFQHTLFTEQLLLSAEKFNLWINCYSSKCILLEEQLVDNSHDLILFDLSVCFNIQNLNLSSAVVLGSPNLLIMEIKDWRSLMSTRSTNKLASAEHLINGN